MAAIFSLVVRPVNSSKLLFLKNNIILDDVTDSDLNICSWKNFLIREELLVDQLILLFRADLQFGLHCSDISESELSEI